MAVENKMYPVLDRFRIVALLEGISLILLVGIAMPLKYYAGFPMAVKVAGWIHGLLFILYLLTMVHAAFVWRWGLWKMALAIIASLLPFGTFFLDYQLKKDLREAALK
jgi:integral membrane protein